MSRKREKKDNLLEEIYKGPAAAPPPACKVALDKEHTVFFLLEDHPREVIAGYKRPTMVIAVNMDKKKCSLFLSNVDLARQVWKIEEQTITLKGITVKITKKLVTGRGYRYQVDEE